MKAEVEVITPERARELLRGNQRNRPLRKAYVRILSEEMKAKKWTFNGVPIIFNGKLLIDGQHRLEACVHSNTPFKTLVVSEVDADAFVTIDVGKKRTAADTLSTKGEQNAAVLAAAATIVDIYYGRQVESLQRFTAGTRGNNRVVTEALKTFPAIRQSVTHCVARPTKLVPGSILAACHYIFSRIDTVLADLFIERLATGTNIAEGSPMAELHARLIDNYTSSRKHSRGYVTSLIIKAWNAERTGRNIKRLRGWTGDNNEAFPEAV